jgi:hypothetical protein
MNALLLCDIPASSSIYQPTSPAHHLNFSLFSRSDCRLLLRLYPPLASPLPPPPFPPTASIVSKLASCLTLRSITTRRTSPRNRDWAHPHRGPVASASTPDIACRPSGLTTLGSIDVFWVNLVRSIPGTGHGEGQGELMEPSFEVSCPCGVEGDARPELTESISAQYQQ